MSKAECKDILQYLQDSYSNFNVTESMFKMWFNELQQYDKEDVLSKIKEMISREIYQLKPPTLMAILKDMPKTQDKLDWTKGVVYCGICGRAFNTGDVKKPYCLNEIHEHEDRCRSIRYIEKQSLKYKGESVNKAKLYNMPKEEFDKYYETILRYILNNTESEDEKFYIRKALGVENG